MNSVKIVYLPLDERPCNYDFPALLVKDTKITMVRPSLEWMGRKKQPGNTDQLGAWLQEECRDAYGAVVSLDTLLYGGIVPSRLHDLDEAAIRQRMERLREVKRENPDLKLFAMHLIMRCPQYSSSDEEPEYYGVYGREIFRKGYISHRMELGLASEAELEELRAIEAVLPQEVEDDYLGRRLVNLSANQLALRYVEEGIIDFMIVPQDDSAPYGWTAKDQQLLRSEMSHRNTELHALMYPGADEAGCTLTIRMINEMNGDMPLVYPRYAGAGSPFVIPLYEDRPLSESVKYQILAAGGQVASSAQEADIILLVNAPGAEMVESNDQPSTGSSYQVLRNIVELVEYGKFMMKRFGKPVAVADVAYANGGDLQLLKLLRQQGILFDLSGYAGWNTSSNTLGTVIAQMMLYLRYGKTKAHMDFLALRYTEDLGYCTAVRRSLTDNEVQAMGYSYFNIDGERGQIAGLVKERLAQFVRGHVDTDDIRVEIMDVYMPWNRMFETGVTVKAIEK
ncbi:DUF4127 family protein [Paenibacillus dakarensis]|uniref:DUF4127 family protein n=1 Tax=Paenibacillus dakarensis TaxID=1527293 RepID=UPI0006D5ACCB|nr:DUF4127 family protein [Paenibacillus dakarensis]